MAFESHGDWDAVVLSLFNNFVVYSTDDSFDPDTVASYIRAKAKNGIPTHVNARLDIADSLEPSFPELCLERCWLATCREVTLDSGCPLPSPFELRPVGPNDLIELLDAVDDANGRTGKRPLADQEAATQRKLASFATGNRSYAIFEKDRILSTASTSAAYSKGAMLTGVATRKAYRNQGLATAVTRTLCSDCLADGMDYVALCYVNPVAARIYHRIGFKDIARFGVFSRRS